MEMKRFKAASLGLALALALQAPAVSVWAASEENGGEAEREEYGDAVETLEIGTAEELIDFARHCSLDSWSAGKFVKLTRDIDLQDTDFQMIPVFAGTFDGDGHTISGFHSVGDGYVGGLFRYISQGGVVQDLHLKGSVVGTEEKECIGSICGINCGEIRGCSFTGILNGKDTVGGIAGVNEGAGFITDCTVRGRVTGFYMTGGIAGLNHGTVTYCANEAGINDDSQWVMEDDEMGGGLLQGLGSSDRDVEIYSGVDTGGIAGYSDGAISRCTNNGRVGYEHSGYNIGGIAGRQAGVVALCTNSGEVYGRKDVGGIVGQMEPYIEVDEAESLRNAVNKLHSLVDAALEHMQDGQGALREDVDRLAAYGEASADSGHAMADLFTEFVDSNMGQLSAADAHLRYVADQLPAVLDDLSRAMDIFRQFGERMRKLAHGLAGQASSSVTGGDAGGEAAFDAALEALQDAARRLESSADILGGLIKKADGSVKGWEELRAQQDQVAQETRNLADALDGMSAAASAVFGKLVSQENRQELKDAAELMQQAMDLLRNASNGAKNIVSYLGAQPRLNFTSLGPEFKNSREDLDSQLRGMADSLKSLSDNAFAFSDRVNEDLRAVNDQLNVVFNLLADHLSGEGGLSVEELYEEVGVDEIDSVTSGRTDACTNKGSVKGDINIGGIVGSMGIDEEDQEENAAGQIDYEVGRRFIMKCIVDNCVNQGYVTAKKDGAGGIAGYMGHGVAIECQSYGSIESTEGGYVGGICGESLTVIVRCYALCDVRGSRNVGGIAGYGATLKDCCAIVNVEAPAGRLGAIAGQTAGTDIFSSEEEPEVCGNLFVGGEPGGIDSISYAGIAEPVDYQELLAVEGIPGGFRHLKVFYRVEDQYLGSEEVAFGESLAGLHYPEIPEREGFYGVWPDCSGQVMEGNLFIDGEYRPDVLVVESSQKEGSGEGVYQKPYALVTQTFTEDAALTVTEGGQQPPEEAEGREYVMYRVLLENSGLGRDDIFAVRLLAPYEDAEVWGYVDGAWTKLESKPRGAYLQVDMTGPQETFCIVRSRSRLPFLAGIAAAAAAGVLLAIFIVKRVRKRAHP